ncbi:MAG: GNAT family N-acetyltransferase [Holosporales bacterium]|nr:GNAT family N-acetyltransferase [Holosporales bacterium]
MSFANYLMLSQYVVMAAINVNGVILGYIICLVVIDEADVVYLCVDDKHRCCGIATQIFKYFINSVSDLKRVHLEVNVDNVRAINFYKRNEFKIIRIRKAYSNSNNFYEMVMCKTPNAD